MTHWGLWPRGYFCSFLLIGTILDTLGAQLGIEALVTIGGYASAMSGPAMAIAIGYALQAPTPGALFLSYCGLCRQCPGLHHPRRRQGSRRAFLAVLFIAIIAAEIGKAVSKETKIDILVTPLATILAGWGCPPGGRPYRHRCHLGGQHHYGATDLQPFLMGIVVSVVIGIAPDPLPISSAAICAALGLTGLAGRGGGGRLLC